MCFIPATLSPESNIQLFKLLLFLMYNANEETQ